MKNKIKKCAIVGVGQWGSIIKRYIENNNNFMLVDVFRGKTLEEYTVFLDSTEASCIFICSPKETHYSYCKTALEYKKNVFCEKPLTSNLIEARKLVQFASEKGVVLYTDYVYTKSPSVRRVYEFIKESNKVHSVSLAMEQFGRFYKDSDAIDTLGVHLISLLELFFPHFECKVLSYKERYLEGYNLPIEQFIILQTEDNVIDLRVSLARVRKNRLIRVVSDLGEISADLNGNVWIDRLHNNCGNISCDTVKFEEKEDNNLEAVIRDFYESLSNEEIAKRNMSITLKVEYVVDLIRKYTDS